MKSNILRALLSLVIAVVIWAFAVTTVSTDADIAMLSGSRVDAILIGTAFMETENPKALATHWRGLFDTAGEQAK